MNPRERVAAVYAGETPDQVPLMLDLSHWYKKNYHKEFNLAGYQGVDEGLVNLHKEVGAVCYCEMGGFYSLTPDTGDITFTTDTKDGIFSTKITTLLGTLYEERSFSENSYSYNIKKHLLESVDDFKIVEYLMDHLTCTPKWDVYNNWSNALGEYGYPYTQLPYSGLGYLISRNFGVEPTVYADLDYPDEMKSLTESVNNRNLKILDSIIDGPFSTLLISDNYDSNIQTKQLFDKYSRDYYTEVARRLHAKGKSFAVHVDGEMRGAVKWMAECGVDCVDAATPAPMFSMTPEETRAQAGNDIILSGGIPATVFGLQGTDNEFIQSVKDWLAIRHISPRLIMAAGDQVPTDAPIHRIKMLPELVDKYGRY
jgi:Uroporphyrinogen decarboxylase (URO-D)